MRREEAMLIIKKWARPVEPFQSQSVINKQLLFTKHIQNETFGNEKMHIDQPGQTIEN